ncbi:MAG: MATE family efflux transporter [Firmicutes bacterium]|nr:MATE family efflux transporter [Bacillota bacterium]
MKNDLTTGSVARTLIKFTIPLLLANLLQAFYAVADMIIVGIFSGHNSISAVSTSGQFTQVVAMLLMGLAMGATVLVAQYEGAKQSEEQGKTVGSAIILFVIVSVVITIAALLSGHFILKTLNTPAEAYDESYRYFMICMSGTIFIMGYNAISSILRGKGDSKTPLVMVTIAAFANVVLDLILVGYFKMGAAGAAYATVAAQALSMVMSLFIMIKNNTFPHFKPSYMRWDKKIIGKLLSIGVPMSIQQTIVSLSFLFLTSITNSFGVIASAAAGIAGKINGFAILPAGAMMMAISAMSGQNIGANEVKRAKQTMLTGIKLIMPFIAIMFVFIFVFAGGLIRIFTPEAEVINIGITFLRICSGEYLLLSIVFSQNGLLVGAGRTRLTLVSSVASSIILRIPLAMFLSRLMGFNGIAVAIAVSPFASLLLGGIFIHSGHWEKPLKVIAEN